MVVNCGGPSGESRGEREGGGETEGERSTSSFDSGLERSRAVVAALVEAFGRGQVQVMETSGGQESNIFAMTGRLAEEEQAAWEESLPDELKEYSRRWATAGSTDRPHRKPVP